MKNLGLESKGNAGEKALEEWLKREGFFYLALSQEKEHFARLFQNNLKRPDFLVLLDSVGMIAVDAKNRKLYSEGTYTLPYEKEFRRTLTFERVFRLPVWYAYQGKAEGTWFWISALKAIEVGKMLTKDEEQFLAIKLEHFEKIESNADFGKLYMQRMPGLSKVKAPEP